MNIPYFYIALEIFLVLVFIIVKTKRSSAFKALLFNLALIVLLLGFAEVYFAEDYHLLFPWFDRGGSEPFSVPDEIRGYALAKNIKAKSRTNIGNKVIYDVVYTSNQYGLRISPHDLKLSSDKDFKNVIFLVAPLLLERGLTIMKLFLIY